MGKKKKLVEKINSLLGTKLELKRIPLAELERLHDAISVKVGAATQGLPVEGLLNAPLVEILRKKLAHKKVEELTLRDLLGVIQEGTEGKGILGLGILPRLFKGRK